MRKVFRKAFRILELDERKGRRVVEEDFHRKFQVNVTRSRRDVDLHGWLWVAQGRMG